MLVVLLLGLPLMARAQSPAVAGAAMESVPIVNVAPVAGPAAAPAETLQTAWAIALNTDQGLAASQWNVSAAQSGLNAARAERMPSVTLGAEYYALSQSPAVVSTVPVLGTLEAPFLSRDAGSGHALVAQPIFTSGRISSGIDAAEANVVAHEADHDRAILDVKMNVADVFVKVLLASRIVEVAQSKVVSLSSHDNDVSVLYEKGVVAKNDLLASQVALANAQQKSLDANGDLEVARAAYNRALGRDLSQPVFLAEVRDEEMLPPLEDLTRAALSQRPELAALSAEARASRTKRRPCGPRMVRRSPPPADTFTCKTITFGPTGTPARWWA